MKTRVVTIVVCLALGAGAGFLAGVRWRAARGAEVVAAPARETVMAPREGAQDEAGTKAATAFRFARLMFEDEGAGREINFRQATAMMNRESADRFGRELERWRLAGGERLWGLHLTNNVSLSPDARSVTVRASRGSNEGVEPVAVEVTLAPNKEFSGNPDDTEPRFEVTAFAVRGARGELLAPLNRDAAQSR